MATRSNGSFLLKRSTSSPVRNPPIATAALEFVRQVLPHLPHGYSCRVDSHQVVPEASTIPPRRSGSSFRIGSDVSEAHAKIESRQTIGNTLITMI
jgi:hypothetical protein